MNKEKFKHFVIELNKLENRCGIFISADYEEEIDYDWDEDPYVSGVSSQLILTDRNGDEMIVDKMEKVEIAAYGDIVVTDRGNYLIIMKNTTSSNEDAYLVDISNIAVVDSYQGFSGIKMGFSLIGADGCEEKIVQIIKSDRIKMVIE